MCVKKVHAAFFSYLGQFSKKQPTPENNMHAMHQLVIGGESESQHDILIACELLVLYEKEEQRCIAQVCSLADG